MYLSLKGFVLALVPTAKRVYTSIGEKTLGVYLLHLNFIRAFRETEAYVWIQEKENYFILILIAWSIVYVLSHKWVENHEASFNSET